MEISRLLSCPFALSILSLSLSLFLYSVTGREYDTDVCIVLVVIALLHVKAFVNHLCRIGLIFYLPSFLLPRVSLFHKFQVVFCFCLVVSQISFFKL